MHAGEHIADVKRSQTRMRFLLKWLSGLHPPAWAERAKTCGYPERFAQAALGHNSKAVHRAYAKKESKVSVNGAALYAAGLTSVRIPSMTARQVADLMPHQWKARQTPGVQARSPHYGSHTFVGRPPKVGPQPLASGE